MLAALAKLRTVASWQTLARLIGLAEPDDYRNRARRPPGEWPLRRPALVGHWRRKIGGGVECYWDVADRSATVLPFKPA
ncbi:MAG: hypothetical protein WCD67_08350, partial [Xanthobacteraceae bacterium]